MSFKEYFFKKMIPNYFMIVTFITIGMAVSGIVFYGNIDISMVTLFVPPLFGVLGSLPMLLIGACLAVIGMKASIPEVVRFWSWDTALVCLPLYLFGYCARRRRWISDFDFKPA